MAVDSFLAGARIWSERLLLAVAVLGGVILFAVMIMVSVAVYCRYVLNAPIFGDVEYIQFGMALVVTAAMPYATLKGAHIRVDILDGVLGAWGRFLADGLARLVMAYVLLLLVQKSWDKALDAVEYGDETNLVELPLWIPYGAITLGFGLFIAVLVGLLIGQVGRGPRDYG